MPRYHINRRTGTPGVCKAQIKCPFGDLISEHYDSREEAQLAYEKKNIQQIFPSFDKGKIQASELPAGMRIDDDTIVVPKGMYVIGDPAYTMGEDNDAWNSWMEQISSEPGSFSRGAVGASMNGYPVVSLTVKLGPGVYGDSFGRQFEVGSGTFGVTPLPLLKKMGLTDEEIVANSQLANFDEPTVLKSNGEILKFGEYFNLYTDQSLQSYDEDEYDSDEYDIDPNERVTEYNNYDGNSNYADEDDDF